MIKTIIDSNNLYDILLEQFKIWWKEEMTKEQFDALNSLFTELNLDKNEEVESIIAIIKNLFVESKNDRDELSKLIDKYLIPAIQEKQQNAEVSTPYQLRQEMLDTIPKEFWTTPHKVFEPCCGKGGFVIDIFNRFKEGGLDDETIIKQCIYFADINPLNVFITTLLLDPEQRYNVNSSLGDTLKMEFDFKFDAVIGNPPYQAQSNSKKKSGTSIWNKFVCSSLNNWLNNKGYLNFVHPAAWRKPSWENSVFNGLFKLMVHDNTMLQLVIRNCDDGQATFKCGTRYDYYLIKKERNNDHLTKINDELRKDHELNLNHYEFLGNYGYEKLNTLFTDQLDTRLKVLKNSSYHSYTNKHVSKEKDDNHQYTLIHSIKKNEIVYRYSSINNDGHFNVSKVIVSDSGINDVIIDMDGKFGCTEHCFYIEIDSEEHGEKIKKALLSDQFKSILKSMIWSNFQIEWRLFRLFKKDFYNELI